MSRSQIFKHRSGVGVDKSDSAVATSTRFVKTSNTHHVTNHLRSLLRWLTLRGRSRDPSTN